MRALAAAVLICLLLAGCVRPYLLGKPQYEEASWTIRVAGQDVVDGACTGSFRDKEIVQEAGLNFTLRRDHAPCMRIEAARKATLLGAFNVSIEGSNQSVELHLDDRARQHADAWFSQTPSTQWVAARPGQLILFIAAPLRPSAAGSWVSIVWEPTTVPDPSEVREPLS